ncbi:MAG: hypothetical protein M0R74_14495, partial [Dehalococcoidia bacterium]|nr:hypothetical protein [Dehalococcoidia bacterium]
ANIYVPKPGGKLELNLGDAWRGRFTEADELPAGAPIDYGYAVLFMGDKGYVSRPNANERWGVIEGAFHDGETVEEWTARVAMEQAGATLARTDLVGYLDCKATSHNPDHPAGTIRVRPIYLVVAKTIDDVPEETGYARRRLPFNEHARAIRDRYPELQGYLSKALDRYMVLRAKGEA